MKKITNSNEMKSFSEIARLISYFAILVVFVLSLIASTISFFYFNTASGTYMIVGAVCLMIFAPICISSVAMFVKKIVTNYESLQSKYDDSADGKNDVVQLSSMEFYAYKTSYWLLICQFIGFFTMGFIAHNVMSMIKANTLPESFIFLKNLPEFFYLLLFWGGFVKGSLKLGEIVMKPFVTKKVGNRTMV